MSESTQKCPSCSDTVPLEYSVCPFCGFGLLEYELKKFSFKPSLKEVFIRLYAYFRHPFRTSEEIAVASEKKGGNIILLLFSLFLSLRFYMVMVKSGIDYTVSFLIGSSDPEKWSMTISMGFILFIVTLFVMPLIIWIMYKIFLFIATWLMSKFAAILGSEASSKQFKSIIGYSLAAITVGEFLGIFLTLMGPGGGLGSSSSINFSSIANYVENLYSSPVMWVFKVIMIALWLVFIIYSSISLRIIGRMAWVNAFVSIAIPASLFVFFFYFAGIMA